MEEKFLYIELFETYKSLLTENQKEIFEMHFSLDLSLTEIAQEKGITRQNASDTLKNVKERLCYYEKALKIKDRLNAVENYLSKLEDKKTAKDIKKILDI